jgi:hypothetical protein
LLKLQYDDATDFAALVKSLKGTFDSLKNLAPTHVAMAQELLEQDLHYILGPGDDSSERNNAKQAILHGENFRSQKKAWAVVEAYIRGRNRKQNAKRLQAGLAHLQKEFGHSKKTPRK